MERYERLALVFDTAESQLGVAALHLIQYGLDPLYARELDELAALARAHAGRVAALVVPGALAEGELDAVLDRILPALPSGRASVVVVAPPRERARLVALRERGLRWVVFAPYQPSELRFAVTAALATGDALEPRCGLRVPTRLPASVRYGGATRSGQITNLSVGGAFVGLPDPPAPGAALSLEFPIGERLLNVGAVVARCAGEARAGRADGGPGVGVVFAGLSPVEAHLIEGFVRECVDSFRL